MELLVLGTFAAMLLICVIFHFSLLYALVGGYLLFAGFALKKKIPFRQVCKLSLEGILTVKNILLTFILIGMLTALWRAGGTVAAIVRYAAGFIRPANMLLLCFLLNCAMSFLTGTSFGTAATMGTVTMTIAMTFGLSPVLAGGAILSGLFFGDRCSPVSTSALLVAELTKTDIFDNIRLMVKTSLIPFFAACTVYGLCGFFGDKGQGSTEILAVFETSFHIGFYSLIPAILVLVLSIFRIPVRKIMAASIAAAVLLCLFREGFSFTEILSVCLRGYRSPNVAIAAMLNGGGVLSMVKVGAIVCISASFSGLLRESGLLEPVRRLLCSTNGKRFPFAIMVPLSVVVCMISCNQTLTTILVNELCEALEPDAQKRAIYLENSAIVLSALIPWCIAGAVPLATIGAPMTAMLAACYLYLLPLWGIVREAFEKHRAGN